MPKNLTAAEYMRDNPPPSRELETAYGTIVTRIDCPDCSGVFDLEGDREGETVTCPDCKSDFRCRRT